MRCTHHDPGPDGIMRGNREGAVECLCRVHCRVCSPRCVMRRVALADGPGQGSPSLDLATDGSSLWMFTVRGLLAEPVIRPYDPDPSRRNRKLPTLYGSRRHGRCFGRFTHHTVAAHGVRAAVRVADCRLKLHLAHPRDSHPESHPEGISDPGRAHQLGTHHARDDHSSAGVQRHRASTGSSQRRVHCRWTPGARAGGPG